MALSTTFASLPAGNEPASSLDNNFTEVGNMGIYRCTASGTNNITLTTNSNQPNISSYSNNISFWFVASATATDSINIIVNSLTSLPVYRQDGASAGKGDIVLSSAYVATYISSLNSGSGGFQLSQAPITSNISSGGFVNRFRNAGMEIWQRGTSGTITAGTPSYSADGWMIGCTGANVTWSQTAGRANTAYALKITGNTSVTDVLVKQRIEGSFCNVLYPQAGTQVTVQAKIYNNTGSSITPTLTVNHATALDNWTSTTTDVSAVSLQTCSNGSLTTVSYTFLSVSGTTNGLEIIFDFGNNFSTTGKSVEISECDIRVTSGISTGLGSIFPTPELRNIGIEMTLCQRYFDKSYAISVSPGTTGTEGEWGIVTSGDTTLSIPSAVFKTRMRTVPTITIYNPSTGSSGSFRINNVNQTVASVNVSEVKITRMYGPSSTSGAFTQFDWTASAEL